MKSFFKKLSFVLAAAMIITLIPAQAAKAEGVIKLAYQNATSVSDAIAYDTLKVGEKQDYKFYGCLDYKTTGLGWVSSNEAVATVDKTGVVTAVAAGVTQISYEAKGYTTEAITLLVADTYNVSIAKQEDKTAVVTSFKFTAIGQEQDFCFVGAQGYSLNTHKCTWFSTNTAVATVDKVGNVTAVGEGNAQIVLTIVEKATNKVAFAVAPVAITVEVAKLEATQTSYNTAKVEFNGAAAADVKVYSVIDGQRQVEYVEVKDGVVTFYNELVNGREYVFTSGSNEDSFVASIAPAASFQLSTTSMYPATETTKERWEAGRAYAGQPTQVQISKLVDANGVAVKKSNYTFEFEDVCDEIKSINYDGIIYIGEKGEKHTVTVTAIDNKTGARVVSESIDVVGEDLASVTIKKETVVARVGKVDNGYSNCKADYLRLSIDDEDAYGIALFLKDSRLNEYSFAAGNVMTGTAPDELNLLRDLGQFVFESTDYDVLGVTDSGVLEARNVGRATILVYFEYVDEDLSQTHKELLTSIPFEVIGHRVPTTVTLDAVTTNMFKNGTYVRLADEPGACKFNTASISYKVKDQLGDDLECEVEAIFSNEGIFRTITPITNGVSVVAKDIDEGDGAQFTSNIRFKFTKHNVTKSASATIVVINIEDAQLSQVPGVVMCIQDKAAGIGNTDNYKLLDNEEVTVGVHIVDVYYVGSAYVYGYDVAQSVAGAIDPANPDVLVDKLRDYSVIKKLSKSTELEAQERGTAGALYVEIKLDNTPINIITDDRIELVDNDHDDDGRADARYIQVTIRKPFEDLAATDWDDVADVKALAGDALKLAKSHDINGDNVVNDVDRTLARAKALAAIKSVKLEANVYDLYNTNTMESTQATTTWKKGVCAKYDSVGTLNFDNNDVKNYAASLDFKDLTYEGDIPGDINGWTDWFAKHTVLTANAWTHSGLANADKGKAFKYTDATPANKTDDEYTKAKYTLYSFDVNTMTSNSKYLQAAGLFFTLYDSGAEPNTVVTYIPYSIGKKVTQENYQYKTENLDTYPNGDKEFPGIWAD